MVKFFTSSIIFGESLICDTANVKCVGFMSWASDVPRHLLLGGGGAFWPIDQLTIVTKEEKKSQKILWLTLLQHVLLLTSCLADFQISKIQISDFRRRPLPHPHRHIHECSVPCRTCKVSINIMIFPVLFVWEEGSNLVRIFAIWDVHRPRCN